MLGRDTSSSKRLSNPKKGEEIQRKKKSTVCRLHSNRIQGKTKEKENLMTKEQQQKSQHNGNEHDTR